MLASGTPVVQVPDGSVVADNRVLVESPQQPDRVAAEVEARRRRSGAGGAEEPAHAPIAPRAWPRPRAPRRRRAAGTRGR